MTTRDLAPAPEISGQRRTRPLRCSENLCVEMSNRLSRSICEKLVVHHLRNEVPLPARPVEAQLGEVPLQPSAADSAHQPGKSKSSIKSQSCGYICIGVAVQSLPTVAVAEVAQQLSNEFADPSALPPLRAERGALHRRRPRPREIPPRPSRLIGSCMPAKCDDARITGSFDAHGSPGLPAVSCPSGHTQRPSVQAWYPECSSILPSSSCHCDRTAAGTRSNTRGAVPVRTSSLICHRRPRSSSRDQPRHRRGSPADRFARHGR